MSEEHTISPVPAPPKRRRRWIVAAITVLTFCGIAYWWQNRLTPDEQLFVGRWEVISDSSGKKGVVRIVEFRGDRTASSDAGLFHWTANNGRFCVQAILPFHERAAAWLEWIRGSGRLPYEGVENYEIVDRDKVIFTYQAESSKTIGTFQRIIEK